MGLDEIKTFVEKAEAQIKNDPNLMTEFKADPVKTLEKVLGVDLPDEQVKAVAELLKSKLSGGAEGVKDVAGEIIGNIENFFHKK